MKQQDVYVGISEFYDHIVPYRDRPDVAFYVDAAKASGGRVLEIGCGTGRILIPTAREGIDIVGLDASTAMLQVCRKRLEQEPDTVQAQVELVQADMRDFELSRTFELITFPFRPFQHLTTVKDQCACLECAHRHLADDGKLILDLFNPALHILADNENLGKECGEEPEFTMSDGRKVVRRHKFVTRDLFNQVQHVELIHYVTHPDGRQERLVQAFDMRYLFRFEAEHLLARCGFQVEQVYADYEKNPYGFIYPGDLIVIATKHTRSLS